MRFITQALWFDLPQKAVEIIEKSKLDYHGGLHAAEHAAIAILPLFAMCDRNDIGVSQPHFTWIRDGHRFLFMMDTRGIGIAEKGYEIIEELWAATLRAIEECPVRKGVLRVYNRPNAGIIISHWIRKPLLFCSGLYWYRSLMSALDTSLFSLHMRRMSGSPLALR